jgi:diketogulonate reductase-like aldo/keto reductase
MEQRHEYILSNGVRIPSIGFGTWQIRDGEEAYGATLAALRVGYRHIDTAAAYGNEDSVGKAIRDSGIPREEVFITSKLKAELKGYETAIEEYEKTITRLGVERLDLYLIHAPKPWSVNSSGLEYTEQNIATWKAFVDLYREGRIRAIGVSNFRPEHLRPIIDATGFAPHANQIFLNPAETQKETVDFERPYGILTEAYSPFATGRLFAVEKLAQIATKYGVSLGRLALRWSLQRGFLPLPKSVTPARIADNLDIFGFDIAASDLADMEDIVLPPWRG